MSVRRSKRKLEFEAAAVLTKSDLSESILGEEMSGD